MGGRLGIVMTGQSCEADQHSSAGDVEQGLPEIYISPVLFLTRLPLYLPTKSISELEETVAKMLTIPRMIVDTCGDQDPESEKMDTE